MTVGTPFAADDQDAFSTPAITSANAEPAAATPGTFTATLPSAGIYLVTVQAKLNGSLDHMMTGLWLVQFYDGANDTLLSTQLGATSKSTGSTFGLGTLALSAPTAGGVVTGTATWTNGNSYIINWTISARRLSPF